MILESLYILRSSLFLIMEARMLRNNGWLTGSKRFIKIQDIWKNLCDKYGYPKVTQEVDRKTRKELNC